MTRLIVCTKTEDLREDNSFEVGKITDGMIYSIWKEDYIDVAIRVLRETTEQEYIEFCASVDFPVRNMDADFKYFEVEILD